MVVRIERKRYLLVEFMNYTPELGELIYHLRKKYSYLFGQIQLARSSLHVVDIIKNYAIVRANHDSRDQVEMTIQLLQLPSNCIPVVRRVSGTIKKMKHILELNAENYRNDD